jgi:hypothetical protein
LEIFGLIIAKDYLVDQVLKIKNYASIWKAHVFALLQHQPASQSFKPSTTKCSLTTRPTGKRCYFEKADPGPHGKCISYHHEHHSVTLLIPNGSKKKYSNWDMVSSFFPFQFQTTLETLGIWTTDLPQICPHKYLPWTPMNRTGYGKMSSENGYMAKCFMVKS